ncbi:MAG: hypothetical protein Ct9H300mP1_39520 [Planctomycetaceae bacterium]|nr:MAG: hypothetical protein Ct9H300mP1_39520 [Planctomycetaceae bacterium]
MGAGVEIRFPFLTQRLTVRAAHQGGNPYVRNPAERFLFCGWHEQLLFGGFAGRSRHLSALISQHRTGRWWQELLGPNGDGHRPGFVLARGTRALRQAMEVTRTRHMAITPDGPRGPRRVLKEGVVYLASRTGCRLCRWRARQAAPS